MNWKRIIKLLTCSLIHDIFVSSYSEEVIKVAEKSRADYFKKRRENVKAFYVEIDKDKLVAFEKKLEAESKSKKEWLVEKINEELAE